MKLRKLFAEVSLENHAMKELFAKKVGDGREEVLCSGFKRGRFLEMLFSTADFKAIHLIINEFIAFIGD